MPLSLLKHTAVKISVPQELLSVDKVYLDL